MGREIGPQGGTGFRLLRAQFWTLAQSKYISEGTQKWTLLGSKVVPPGGPVFGPFILSDVLKFCRLLCAQNVKREATYTNSIRGRTLELGRPEVASPIFLVFEGPKIDPSKRPPLGRRSWHGWQRGTQCHQNTEEVHTLVSRITIFSEAWIGFNELPSAPNTNVDTDINSYVWTNQQVKKAGGVILRGIHML